MLCPNCKKEISEDSNYCGYCSHLIEKVDIKKENETSLEKKLIKFDVVFVTGGNNFYLLNCVRSSGFDKAIRKFLDKGGIYYGCSAGSIVTGLNIESAQWRNNKNTIGLKDLTGLKLVPFVISVHIDDNNIRIIKDAAARVKYPVVALTDKQAIVVEDGKHRIVGIGKKNIFNTEEKF